MLSFSIKPFTPNEWDILQLFIESEAEMLSSATNNILRVFKLAATKMGVSVNRCHLKKHKTIDSLSGDWLLDLILPYLASTN